MMTIDRRVTQSTHRRYRAEVESDAYHLCSISRVSSPGNEHWTWQSVERGYEAQADGCAGAARVRKSRRPCSSLRRDNAAPWKRGGESRPRYRALLTDRAAAAGSLAACTSRGRHAS
ncbi:unnamed protein product [Colias eurytheme]|nr:unnamed protein product [Colias eurytheme]